MCSHKIGPPIYLHGFTRKSFDGIAVTNSGYLDIVITEFAFETGRINSNGDDDSLTAVIVFHPTVRYGQNTISTMLLPHRLRYGESFRVLFDREILIRESTRIDGITPVNMRPFCRDSLGNKHKPDFWVVYESDNSTAFFKGPSPGCVSEEEWENLSAEEQLRYQWNEITVTDNND